MAISETKQVQNKNLAYTQKVQAILFTNAEYKQDLATLTSQGLVSGRQAFYNRPKGQIKPKAGWRAVDSPNK